jgi:membrane-associated phospholipid phosphatase
MTYPALFTGILSVIFSVFSPLGLGELNTVQSMVIGVIFLSVVPIAPILYYMRIGKVDINVSAREKRTSFYIVAIIGQIIAVLIFLLTQTTVMFVYSLAVLLVTIVGMLINLKWKISVHTFGISSDVAALLYVYGMFLWPVLVLIPFVAFFRYKTKAHSITQLIAGITLGIVITILVYYIFYP